MKALCLILALILSLYSCDKDAKLEPNDPPFYYQENLGLFWAELTYKGEYFSSLQFPEEGLRLYLTDGKISINPDNTYSLEYQILLIYENGYDKPDDLIEMFTHYEKGTITFTRQYHFIPGNGLNFSTSYFTGVMNFYPDNGSTWSSAYTIWNYGFDLYYTPIREGKLKTHWL